MSAAGVRLFQRAVYAWLMLYVFALLLLGDDAWVSAPVKVFSSASGWLVRLQAGVNGFPTVVCMLIGAVVVGTALSQMRRQRWWLGLVVWLLFRVITHRTWLASNGGVQLMENMLIWCALMGQGTHPFIGASAFWIARLQLLLAYGAAAAHKCTGTAWLDGSAMMMVARDPVFNLHWLATSPGLCAVLTYCTLAFMTLFPLVVWWSPSRRIFLLIGVAFHLATAIFMGIPQMGFAFIACYALWLDDESVQWLATIPARMSRRITSLPSPGPLAR